MKTFAILAGVSLILCIAATSFAGPVSFAGSYSENFDELGTTGTAMPAGFREVVTPGANNTYNAGNPMTTAIMAGLNTTSGVTTLSVWNPPSNAGSNNGSGFKLADTLANAGNLNGGVSTDRALGSGPTTDGGTTIELSLTNNTGSALSSVNFAYDMKVLCMGNAGDESASLPGYSFFYSTNGSTWTASPTLSSGGYTVGQTYHMSSVVTLGSGLANTGTMYFRWFDGNNLASSPDQTIAIDNLAVTSVTPEPCTLALLGLGGGLLALRRRKAA
jgi:hypothetical protein